MLSYHNTLHTLGNLNNNHVFSQSQMVDTQDLGVFELVPSKAQGQKLLQATPLGFCLPLHMLFPLCVFVDTGLLLDYRPTLII